MGSEGCFVVASQVQLGPSRGRQGAFKPMYVRELVSSLPAGLVAFDTRFAGTVAELWGRLLRPAGFVAFGQTKTFDVAFEQQLHLTACFSFSPVVIIFDNVR